MIDRSNPPGSPLGVFHLELTSPREDNLDTVEKLERALAPWLHETFISDGPARQQAAQRIIECWSAKSDNLDLSNLGIHSLPDVLSKFDQLASLDVSGNKIESFPDACLALKQLHILDISDNPIEFIEADLDKLRSLKVLFANRLPLTEAPCALADLPGDCTVFLRAHNLDEVELKSLVNALKDQTFPPHIETKAKTPLERAIIKHYTNKPRTTQSETIAPSVVIHGFATDHQDPSTRSDQ